MSSAVPVWMMRPFCRMEIRSPEPQRLVQIVADEQDGLLDSLLQRQELALELAANQRIERGEGLVHQ